jgi:transcriptional regulator with XRE-family HTH domain
MAISDTVVTARLFDLAERLQRARLAENLTQQALADRCGVSVKTIGNAEDSGQVSLDTFVRLLDGLGRIDEIEDFLAATGPSPIELARQQGKRRQRARSSQSAENDDSGEWQW